MIYGSIIREKGESYMLKFAENIAYLRKKRKIKQEELAAFVGVTKASVSKWENGQSMPDVLILPKLATFFDVTIDALIGYEPQLSKEQIHRKYQELSENFVNMSFDDAMNESRKMVRTYYSCYSFLNQITVLWLNHFMLAKPEQQTDILEEILDLCQHILENCMNIRICKEVTGIEAMVNLQLQRYNEVIESLEEVVTVDQRNLQLEGVLAQAYVMKQEKEKAEKTLQSAMFLHFCTTIACGVMLLQTQLEEKEKCVETIKRVTKLEEAFHLEKLHPNLAAQFHYQAAVNYAIYEMNDEAIAMLQKFERDVYQLIVVDKLSLHGDEYFSMVSDWLAEQEAITDGVRAAKTVEADLKDALINPVFQGIREEKAFKKIQKAFEMYGGGKENA